MNITPLAPQSLCCYAAQEPGQSLYIIGTTAGLTLLRQAVDLALSSKRGYGLFDVENNRGTKNTLWVLREDNHFKLGQLLDPSLAEVYSGEAPEDYVLKRFQESKTAKLTQTLDCDNVVDISCMYDEQKAM